MQISGARARFSFLFSSTTREQGSFLNMILKYTKRRRKHGMFYKQNQPYFSTPDSRHLPHFSTHPTFGLWLFILVPCMPTPLISTSPCQSSSEVLKRAPRSVNISLPCHGCLTITVCNVGAYAAEYLRPVLRSLKTISCSCVSLHTRFLVGLELLSNDCCSIILISWRTRFVGVLFSDMAVVLFCAFCFYGDMLLDVLLRTPR